MIAVRKKCQTRFKTRNYQRKKWTMLLPFSKGGKKWKKENEIEAGCCSRLTFKASSELFYYQNDS